MKRVAIVVDSHSLRKRRWRGAAEDGRELGFDLDRPLADGDTVFESEDTAYILVQKPEPVLTVSLAESGVRGPADFARLGWLIGNLHFPLALESNAVLVPDDPALRQLFQREGLAYAAGEHVFRPLSGGHSHAP